MNSQPDFHDGFIDGLLTSTSEVRVFLRSVHEEKFTLVLDDVEALRVDGLRQGNIILTMEFLKPEQLKASDVRELYQYSHEHMKTFMLGEWATMAREKGLSIVIISPSYGCSFIAAFRRRELVKGHVM